MSCGCKNRNDEEIVLNGSIISKIFQILIVLLVIPIVIPIAGVILIVKFVYGISTGRAIMFSLDGIVNFAERFRK